MLPDTATPDAVTFNVTLPGLMVDGIIASLKVTVRTLLMRTPDAELAGDVLVTLGGVVSRASVDPLQATCRIAPAMIQPVFPAVSFLSPLIRVAAICRPWATSR